MQDKLAKQTRARNLSCHVCNEISTIFKRGSGVKPSGGHRSGKPLSVCRKGGRPPSGSLKVGAGHPRSVGGQAAAAALLLVFLFEASMKSISLNHVGLGWMRKLLISAQHIRGNGARERQRECQSLVWGGYINDLSGQGKTGTERRTQASH